MSQALITKWFKPARSHGSAQPQQPQMRMAVSLPPEMWMLVFDFLAPYEEWPVAAVCKLFYALLTRKRPKCEPARWCTYARPFYASLERTQWAHSQGRELSQALVQYVVVHIADGTKFADWLYANCAPDVWTTTAHCYAACWRGNLNALKWLHGHGAPWHENCAFAATVHGHLDMLRWAIENGCPYKPMLPETAAAYGDVRILEWFESHGIFKAYQKWILRGAPCEIPRRKIALCNAAARGGHMNTLQWAHARGCGWGPSTCALAAGRGNLDMLVWLREHGCPWDHNTCTQAIFGGHMSVLEWAADNGCDVRHFSVAHSAARHGDVAILRFLRTKQAVFNYMCCTFAAMHDRLDALKWLREHGCTWDRQPCINNALPGSELIEWLRNQAD